MSITLDYTKQEFPVAPWDSPGLSPRPMDERCARHSHCAYRDDDPARCPRCHASLAKVAALKPEAIYCPECKERNGHS